MLKSFIVDWEEDEKPKKNKKVKKTLPVNKDKNSWINKFRKKNVKKDIWKIDKKSKRR